MRSRELSDEPLSICTNFFVRSPNDESYREGCESDDGVPTLAVEAGLGWSGRAPEDTDPSSRGDADNAEPDSSVSRDGVGNKRCPKRLTGEGTNDVRDEWGEETVQGVTSEGANNFDDERSMDFVGVGRTDAASNLSFVKSWGNTGLMC